MMENEIGRRSHIQSLVAGSSQSGGMAGTYFIGSNQMKSSDNNNNKKRRRDDIDEYVEPTEEELSKMSRAERKRHREKKRRSEVNKGFDDLMALLLLIDPSIKAEAEEKARGKSCKSGSGKASSLGPSFTELGGDSSSIINRVELISRTVTVLEKLYHENEKNKKMVRELLKDDVGNTASEISSKAVAAAASTKAKASAAMADAASAAASANEYVAMMMPMLTPLDAPTSRYPCPTASAISALRSQQIEQQASIQASILRHQQAARQLAAHKLLVAGLPTSSDPSLAGLATPSTVGLQSRVAALAGLSSLSGGVAGYPPAPPSSALHAAAVARVLAAQEHADLPPRPDKAKSSGEE